MMYRVWYLVRDVEVAGTVKAGSKSEAIAKVREKIRGAVVMRVMALDVWGR